MSESDRPTGPTESATEPHHTLAEPGVATKKARGPKRTPAALRWFGGLKRETRFGIAALLSSGILVGVLGINKWRSSPTDTTGKSPVLALANGAVDGTQIQVSPAGETTIETSPPDQGSEGLPPHDSDVQVAEDNRSKNELPPVTADSPLLSPSGPGEGNAPPLPVVADATLPPPSLDAGPPPADLPPPTASQEPPTMAAAETPAALPPAGLPEPKPVQPAPAVADNAPALTGTAPPTLGASDPLPAPTTPEVAPRPVPIPVVSAPAAIALPIAAVAAEIAVRTASAPAPASDDNFKPLPNIGTPGMIESTPPIDSARAATSRSAAFADEAAADFSASALPKATVRDDSPAEVSLHKVARGENFWTISKYYYNSGRYYKALYAANRDKATAIDKLYVGTTIRVPPPEQLNVSLIEPLPPATIVAPASKRLTKTGNRNEVDLATPVDEAPESNLPSGSTRAKQAPVTINDPDEPPVRSDLPIYKVKKTDTFRSIARDTLGSSQRYHEILKLNRDVIDDPDRPTPGQILRLPTDARVSQRRGRP